MTEEYRSINAPAILPHRINSEEPLIFVSGRPYLMSHPYWPPSFPDTLTSPLPYPFFLEAFPRQHYPMNLKDVLLGNPPNTIFSYQRAVLIAAAMFQEG